MYGDRVVVWQSEDPRLVQNRMLGMIASGAAILMGVLLVGLYAIAASQPGAQAYFKQREAERISQARRLAKRRIRFRSQSAETRRKERAGYIAATKAQVRRTGERIVLFCSRFDAGLKMRLGDENVLLYRFIQTLLYVGVPVALVIALIVIILHR
jgi:hypothetical protein